MLLLVGATELGLLEQYGWHADRCSRVKGKQTYEDHLHLQSKLPLQTFWHAAPGELCVYCCQRAKIGTNYYKIIEYILKALLNLPLLWF